MNRMMYGNQFSHYEPDFENMNEIAYEVGFEKKQDKRTQIFDLNEYRIDGFNTSNKDYSVVMGVSREQCTALIVDVESKQQRQVMIYNKENYRIMTYELISNQEQALSIINAFFSDLKKNAERESDKVHNIRYIFMDQVGYHTFFSSYNGDNYYINTQMNQIRQLKNLKETVTCMAFNQQEDVSKDSTGQILVGTQDGKIMLYQIDYKSKTEELHEVKCKVMIQINQDDNYIRYIDYFKIQMKNSQQYMYMVIASTRNKFLQFTGACDFDRLFEMYNRDKTKMEQQEIEFPKSDRNSLCHLYYQSQKHPNSMLWTNGQLLQVYRFTQYYDENVLNNQTPLKYARKNQVYDQQIKEMPVGICITDLHYYILHEDCLTIVSRITEQIVQVYDKEFIDDRAMSISYNQLENKITVISRKRVYKLSINNEDKDAWKLYKDKNMLQEAYDICKKYNNHMIKYVCGIYANSLIEQIVQDQDDYINSNKPLTFQSYDEFYKKQYQKTKQAAKLFYESDVSFEQVVLNFHQKQIFNGLQFYLQEWLMRINRDEKVQKIVLLSYLTELKLYQLNKLESEIIYFLIDQDNKKLGHEQNKIKDEKKKEFRELREEFFRFLKKYKDDLDAETTQQLLVSHGRVDECLEYFKEKELYEEIIKHHINQENYEQAIEYLHKITDKDKRKEILQTYVHIFMKYQPEKIITFLKNHYIDEDPFFFIPYLSDIQKNKQNLAIEFVYQIISRKDQEYQKRLRMDRDKSKQNEKIKGLYNIYIYLLAEQKQNTQKLEDFLNNQEKFQKEYEMVMFDLDFALRMFKKNDLVKGQIKIYGMMGLYNEAVNLALKHGDNIELAEEYAQKPQNIENQRKLWLDIAIHLFNNKRDIKEIIMLIEKNKNKLLKIQDILPHFNENININDFKDQLCSSLSEYNTKIDQLQQDMDGYSQNVDQQLNELRAIDNKYFIIESNKLCDQCNKSIFNDQESYVFPCSHAFHQNCMIERFKEYPRNIIGNKLEEIIKAQDELEQIKIQMEKNNQKSKDTAKGFLQNLWSNTFRSSSQSMNVQYSLEEQKKLQEIQDQLNDLLASECLNCGPTIVDLIEEPFEEDNSWNL